MFLIQNRKVHQTLPGAGWRALHTGLAAFDVTDDAVLAWVTYKETYKEQVCVPGVTWVGPLTKRGLLSDIYKDDECAVEYLRPDATEGDFSAALDALRVEWNVLRGSGNVAECYSVKGVRRG